MSTLAGKHGGTCQAGPQPGRLLRRRCSTLAAQDAAVEGIDPAHAGQRQAEVEVGEQTALTGMSRIDALNGSILRRMR